MPKDSDLRRRAHDARMAAQRAASRSVHWHENNVLRLAIRFSDTFVTSVGYGGPVARAAGILNDAVEQLQAARRRPSPPTPRGEP